MKWTKEHLDIRIILIVLLIAVSTGHVGRVFADREAMDQWAIGYLFAVALDGVLAVALYEISYAKEKKHQLLALGGFMVACGISGGFNVYYYRLFYSADPFEISILLGVTAPVLAAFLALLKSRGDVTRQESAEQLELETLRILQDAETKRAVAVAAEKTKQSKELTKRRQLAAAEKGRKRVEIERKESEAQQQELARFKKELPVIRILSKNPSASQEEIANQVGKSQRTVSTYMKTLEAAGAISRDNGAIKVLWELS